VNRFQEQLKEIKNKKGINIEKKLTFFQRLTDRFKLFKLKTTTSIKRLFSKEKSIKVEEVFLETVIIVDMGKIEYIDLEKLLSAYDDKIKLFLIAKRFNKFNKERVSKLPYEVNYVQVSKKVSTGKQLKLVLKELRLENRYKIITIKGRGSHLIETYLPVKKKEKHQPLVKKERWLPFKELFHLKLPYPTLKDIQEQKNLSQIKNHLVLWDIENISYKNVAKIVSKLGEVNSFYCVSVEPLSAKVTGKLFFYTLRYNMRIKVGHLNSDDEIVRLIESQYKNYKIITIISSDTDFVPIVKKLLKEDKKVQIIGIESQKKGIFMKNNIGDANLKIITI